jgi:hypothetical protein
MNHAHIFDEAVRKAGEFRNDVSLWGAYFRADVLIGHSKLIFNVAAN